MRMKDEDAKVELELEKVGRIEMGIRGELIIGGGCGCSVGRD